MISIIIPTLNEEKIIEKMVNALRDLRDLEYEIIVSDGHSTDRTAQIARENSCKVVIHDGKTRQTIGGGRNAGAKVAQGEYLLFLDSDVFILDINSLLRKALSLFASDPKLVGITSNVRVLKEFETYRDYLNFGFINLAHRFSNNILRIGMSMGEFQMVRKEAFELAGGFNEKLVVGEDQEFFRRLSKYGRTLLPQELVIYHTGRRIHKLGWIRMWTQWMVNGISVTFFKKSVHKEWKPIR